MRRFVLWCVLCDHEGSDVAVTVTRYRDDRYQAVPRCRDDIACRARVEASGREWPVAERRRR